MIDNTVLVAGISGVVGPAIILIVKHFLEQMKAKKPTDFITDAVKLGNIVNTKLSSIKDHYQADRVWLLQFHNGGVFYPSGKSIAKFSIFYDISDNTVENLQGQFQAIPIFIYSNLIDTIKKHGHLSVPDVKSVSANMNLIDSTLTPSQSKYYFAIKSAIDDRLIGIMGIDYIQRKKNMTEIELDEITNFVYSVGGLLTTHLQ